MTNRLVIFHINTEMGFRGGEIQNLHLVSGLQQRGHENWIFVRPGSRIRDVAAEKQFHCVTLPMRGEWDVLSARALRRHIQVHRPHLVHAHTAHACSMAILARWPNDHPRIIYSRRVSFPKSSTLVQRKMKYVDALLAVSNAVRDQLIKTGVPAEKIYVAESGTDFSIFDQAPDRLTARNELGISEKSFVIGNVSFFDTEKGQESLIRVFCEFRKNYPESVLLLVGEGPRKAYCQQLAKELHCEDSVVFVSYRSDIERIYPAMDVFFLSSMQGEGWSGVIREAMACEIPVIAVHQASTAELVQSGILVSKNLAEWRQALERLHADPELRMLLAKNALEYVRTFSIEAMVYKTENCYRSVLNI
jgi:glycosyltransferase involved in cell wall biosynthesis